MPRGPWTMAARRNRSAPYSWSPSVQRHIPANECSYLLALPCQSTITLDDDDEEEEEEEESPEIDFEDQVEVFVLPSPGVGGLLCRIPRESDKFYNDGVSAEMIDEFLRTMSCEEAAADGGGEEVCAVCQDDLCREDRTVGILECGHRFHADDCVREWLVVKNVCPLCKAFGIGCFT